MTTEDRVRTLIAQMIEVRTVRRKDVPVPARTLTRALSRGNITLKLFATIADSLGYELVINVREKKKDPNV